jgi:leader peptidase (prepilin peptidase)/N-methyltransferase
MRAMVELINGWIAPVAAGPIIGSFLGVLVRRLPEGRGVATGRSACEACGHALGPAELVPVLSYLAQRGRCRACGAQIAPMHLYIELAATAVAISAALGVPAGPFLWVSCGLGWALLTLGWIDAGSFLLPDVITLPLLLAGLAEAFFLEPERLTDRALAAALAYTALWALALAYRRLRGRDGLGLGDAKLLAAGGAWLGLAPLPYAMLAGALLGLGWAGGMRLRGVAVSATTRLPFGPFLAAGIWLAWLLAG